MVQDKKDCIKDLQLLVDDLFKVVEDVYDGSLPQDLEIAKKFFEDGALYLNDCRGYNFDLKKVGRCSDELVPYLFKF